MNSLIEFFARQHSLVNILTVFVLVAGTGSLLQMKREAFPDISFDIVTIMVPFPNASAESVEALITSPLESDLLEVEGVKEMNSISIEGRSLIILQLDPDQVSIEDAKSDAQDVVDSFTDFPEGALDPVIVATDSNTRGLVEVAVSSPGMNMKELRPVIKKLKRQIEKIDGIASVKYKGLPEYELRIEAVPEKMERWGVGLTDLIRTLSTANIDVPGGTEVFESSKEFVVKTLSSAETAEELENVVIRSNFSDRHIRVKDVAKVDLQFAKEDIIYRTNQARGVNLVVGKKKSADSIRVVDELKAELVKFRDDKAPQLEFEYVNDISKFVKRRVSVLSNNLIVGLVLVLIVLSIMLPFRMAIVAAMGIPFSFLVTMMIFQAGDVSLNLISMMGLIIVLGMLVDDAVVVTENAQKKMDEGMSPQDAAIAGTQEIWRPVTTSISTTLAAFLPLMFMSGIFGKFMSNLPIGVVLALIVSLWECLFVLPSHVASWVGPNSGLKKRSDLWENYAVRPYLVIISFFIRLRYLVVMGLGALIIFSGWFAVTQMDFKLFPGAEDDNFRLSYEMTLGSPLEQTEGLAEQVENVIGEIIGEDLESIVTTVGIQPKEGPVAIGENRGSNYAQSIFYLKSKDERRLQIREIIEKGNVELEKIPGLVEFTFERGQAGPPVGKAVNLKVIGEDYDLVKQVVDEIKDELATVKGVRDIGDSLTAGKEEVVVQLDEDRISLAGVNKLDVANTVRAMFDGIVVDELTRVDDKIEIVVTLPKNAKTSIESIKAIQIPNRVGKMVTVGSVAEIQRRQSIGAFEHLDGLRALQVQAEVVEGELTSMEANNILKERLVAFQKKYPDLSFRFGGEERDSQESFETLQQTSILAILGIFMLLILQFNNFTQPFIVLGIIPLGLISVVWTFYVHGLPISFLSMIGMIALAGVIVNNAIVLIDQANREIRNGMAPKDAFKQAGLYRLRPIFLTTVTTTAGILPTGYGLGGKDDFVVPIALALGWGLFFGAFLTAFVLPTILSISDDFRIIFERYIWQKKSATPAS